MRGRSRRIRKTVHRTPYGEDRIRNFKIFYLSSFICPLFFILTFSSLLICSFTGCQPEDASNEAKISIDKRKADLFKQLEMKFENPDVHYELGQLYLAESNWAKAEYHFNIALSFEPAHRPAQAALVKGLIKNSHKSQAEKYAKDYINRVSGSAKASLELADAFHKQGLDEYALTSYQQALRLEPNSPDVHKQLGYYYLSKNDNTKAQDYFSRSFQLNPKQPDVAGELGRLGVVVRIPGQAGGNPGNAGQSEGKSDI